MLEPLEEEIRTLHAILGSDRDPDGRAFAPLADAYRRAGQPRKAFGLLTDGLARLPDFTSGHVVAARLYAEQGLFAEGELAARRALDLDPDNVIAMAALARVLESSGKTEEASETRTTLSLLEPEVLVEEGLTTSDSEEDGTVATEAGSDESEMELAALAPDEPEMELADLAPDEPVMDLAELAPEEPVMELATLAPDEPVMDLADLAPEEPVVEFAELAPDEPVMDLADLAPEEPVVELADLAPEEPVMDLAELAPEEPVMDLAELAPEEPVVELAELAPEEPAVDLAELAPEEPVLAVAEPAAEEPVAAGAAVSMSGNGSDRNRSGSEGGPAPRIYTRTLGELYARQGFVDRAVEVFRQLHAEHPEDAGLVQRLSELEDELSGGAGRPAPRKTDQVDDAPNAERARERDEELESLARDLAGQRRDEPSLDTPFAWTASDDPEDTSEPEDEGPSIESYFQDLLSWQPKGQA